MFKKTILTSLLVVVIGALVFGAVNRTLAKNDTQSYTDTGHESDLLAYTRSGSTDLQADEYGKGGGGGPLGDNPDNQASIDHLTLAAPGELGEAEASALLYMREEEKLAYDVYTALYAQWGLPIFRNIARSELTHTEAIYALLQRYSLQDTATTQASVFTNPDLQALYDELIARGSQSLEEALRVGAAIEEIDILDLEKRLAETDNADIQQVFDNLLRGSRNHLRSFTAILQTQSGEIYQPLYLDAAAYQGIVESGTEAGGYGGGNGFGGNRP
jgi:hypothetical protein